jgi:3-deoxy-manno-octulosonate cytidylyltransferase (CMP-KDO synthetase)
MKKRVLLLIPARYQSSRFPGKPLAKISGISMISRVLTNMSQFDCETIEFDTFVVTDDDRIESHIKSFGGNVVRVDDDVISGTLRIELAYSRFFSDKKYDLVINVQGDEPLLKKSEIIELAKFHFNSNFDVTTMIKKNFEFDESFRDPNKVKAVVSEIDGKALYFSRSPIPYKRDLVKDVENDFWFLHIGVYSYRPNALLKFSTLKESRLENLEKLEQLRALENGMTFGAIETKSILLGVDTPEDIAKVEKVLNQ